MLPYWVATSHSAPIFLFFWKYFEISENDFGINYQILARTLRNLANLLMLSNRFQEAEPFLKRSLEIFKESNDNFSEYLALTLNDLGLLFFKTNRIQEAESYLMKSLLIYENCFGGDHPNIGIALNNIAEILKNTNRFKDAKEYY